jgi:hypothetical protein
MAKDSANADGKQNKDHLWKKGQSGNPSGKKPGTRHKATRLAETLLDGEAEELVKKCVEMAIDGDSTAMRICMDRLVPPRKSRPLSIDLPDVNTSEGVSQAQATAVQAVADGEVTPEEGKILADILEARRKSIETQEHEVRLNKLEGQVANEKK